MKYSGPSASAIDLEAKTYKDESLIDPRRHEAAKKKCMRYRMKVLTIVPMVLHNVFALVMSQTDSNHVVINDPAGPGLQPFSTAGRQPEASIRQAVKAGVPRSQDHLRCRAASLPGIGQAMIP